MLAFGPVRGPTLDSRANTLPLAALALCGAALAGCGPAPAATGADPAAPPAPRDVHVAEVAPAAWPKTVRVTGTLVASDATTVRAEGAGVLLELGVDLGARVAAGQALARVDDAPQRLEVERVMAALAEARARVGLAAALASEDGDELGPASDEQALTPETAPAVRLARAQLVEAQARHARVLQLTRDGIATLAERDAAVAALGVAEERVRSALDALEADRAAIAVRRAELALARERLARTVTRAPFAGVIAARLLSPGERVDVGTPLLRLVRVDPLRLVVDVPELVAAGLRPGLTLSAQVDGLAATVEAEVTRVSPEIDAAARTRRVEADVPNPDGALPAGAFVRLELVLDPAAQTLTAPSRAVRSFAGLDKLLVVTPEGVAREVLVQLGRRDAERVEVLDGMPAGSRVVLDPGGLQDGAPVRVVE